MAASADLGFSSRDYESCPHHHQYHAERGRHFLIVFRGDADMSVAHIQAVMFRMRQGNEKGNDP